MGRWVTLIIIIAIVVFGGGYLWQQKTAIEDRENLDRALADARRSFADLARAATKEEDEESYRRQILAALKTYENELDKRVYAIRPEWRDVEAFKKQVDQQFEDGKLREASRKRMFEGYDIVKDAYETLKKGRWKSVLTQADPDSGTRLDIYAVRRIRDDEGNPLLEGRFFFWGVEDSTRVNWGELSLRYWHTVEKTVRKRRRKVTEEVEEVLARAEGESTPRLIIQNPNRYIAEFPSYVSVGYIWLPVMPRQATKFDLTITYSARKGGAAKDAELKWKKLPIPSRWQLNEGEAWDADVVEATAEEIAGKDEEEDEEEKEGEQTPN